MAGMIGLGPTDSTSAQAMGTDLVPAGAGEVLGSTFSGGWSENITTRLFRTLGREGGAASVDFPAVDPMGNPLGYSEHADIPGDPILPAEELNKQYGIKGVLSFDKPGTAAAAEALQKHKREQLAVADTLARSDGSLLASAPIRFATSLAAGLLDPLNVAAAFIPVVGEARAAVMLEQAGGAFGRAAVRAGVGAAEGAAGMAALEPLSYALDVAEHNDWTMAKALQNIAFGGVLGGGLHVAGGAVRDVLRAPRGGIAERMEAAGPEAREAALRGSVAAVVEGRPVEVASAIDLLEARRASADLDALARRSADIEAERARVADASQPVEPQDRSGRVEAATGELSGLRKQAEALRNEIAGLRETGVRQTMDPASAERLQAVEADLAGTLPAARRRALEAERTMLLEGRDAGREMAAAGTLEAGRTQAQIAGLSSELSRTEAAVIKAEQALEKIRAEDAAERAALAEQNRASTAHERIQAAKMDAQQALLEDLATRAMRRAAGETGFRIGDRDGRDLARAVLRGELTPAEAMEAIQRWRREATDDALLTQRPDFATMAERLRQEAERAATNLRDAARRDPMAPDDAAGIREVTEQAARKQPTTTELELADVQQRVADLQQAITREREAGRLPEAAEAQLKQAERMADELEGNARAFDAAAACMVTRA